MSLIFNARFIPQTTTTLSSDTFGVTATIFDGNGSYTGRDVEINDAVFLDAFSIGRGVSKYKIIAITSKDNTLVNIVIQYVDVDTVVDPIELLGYTGFICRQDAMTELSYHTAPSIHNIPAYIVDYARSYDNYIKLPTLISGGGGSSDSSAIKAKFYAGTDGSVLALSIVRQDTSGYLFAGINAKIESQATSIIGVVPNTIPSQTLGDVILKGRIVNIGTSFSVNDVIYLGVSGACTHTPPEIGVGGFEAGDFVVEIGRVSKNADNPTQKDLLVDIKVIGQL